MASRLYRLTAAAAALIATSCLSCTTPASRQEPPAPHATPARPAGEAGAEVCAQFATAMFTADTRTDASPADARQRAATQFGTPQLQAQFTGHGRDHFWSVLEARHGRTEVLSATAAEDDPPRSGPDRVAAGFEVTRRANGDDGWQEALPPAVVYCTVSWERTAWKVVSVRLSDSGPVQ